MTTNDSKDQGREAFKLLEALIDILDDEQNNAPEHRCYVESAWNDTIADARALIDATSASALARDEASVHPQWIVHWAGSNPYKGWSIRSGRDEVVWFGEHISSEALEAIVAAHNKCFDCDGKVCVMNCSGLLLASPAASSAATVSDAASVLTDDQIIEIASRYAHSDGWLNGDGALNFARALLATPQAATTAGAQDERAALIDRLCGQLSAAVHFVNSKEFDKKEALSLIDEARAAFSATAPLTSDSDACELCKGVGQIGIPGQRCFACDGSGKSFAARAKSTNGEQS